MLLREFLGIREPETTARCAGWIRSQQRDDGTWSNFYGGPADLSTTIESYVALRLAGDAPEEPHMQWRPEYIRAAGGLQQARVFTHIWLALFGAWPWTQVPALPTEMIFLPEWFPLNVYDFACWARQTVVALSVVLALRPVRPLPFTLDELDGPEPWAPPTATSAVRSWRSSRWTRSCRLIRPPVRAAAPRRTEPGWSAGSSTARRPMAAGAAFSRRGCTR